MAARLTSNKSLALLGLDKDASALPDELKQEQVYYPDEIKNSELESFTMRDLYNIHLGQSSLPSTMMGSGNYSMDLSNGGIYTPVSGHEATSTSFQNAMSMTSMTTLRGIEEIDEKSASNASSGAAAGGADAYYQLVFDIKHCIFKAGNDTKLLFSIFDDTHKKIITEEYCLHLSANNFPKVGTPEDCKVLFSNLSAELLKNDIYILCRIYRLGPMDAPDVMHHKANTSKKAKGRSADSVEILRPYGSTVIRLKKHIPKLLESLGEEIKCEPGEAPICCPNEESQFVPLTFDLIQDRKGTYTTAPLSIGIAHGLQLFRGDITVVQQNYPHFDKLTIVDPLSIDPAFHSDRHILYVTVHDVHVNQRKKSTACNVCIKIQLRENDPPYKPVAGSMLLGKGKMAVPESETTSPVYYHNNDPIINQTYHILVPSNIKKLTNCHLYFSLWHIPASSKKPDERGFAYLKLFQEKTQSLTNNNEYELPLFRHDKKSVNSYLSYQQGQGLKAENKTIRIYFKLSSTKIYSHIDIQQFFNWRDNVNTNINAVKSAVKRVARQPFVNLLTILDEFMANIFGIMLESQDEALIEQTFSTLVGVLGEVNKNTTNRYKPRIEGWIENHFCYPKVWRILAMQQSRLLQWIASSEAVEAQQKEAPTELKTRSAEQIRQLHNSMKAVKYIFNIMKRSCQIEIEQSSNVQEKNKITMEYNRQISALFQSMNRVMGLKQPKAVAGVQSFALRNFLGLLDSIPTQTSPDLTQIVVKFINAINNDGKQISIEKLLLVRRCLSHPKLQKQDIIRILLPSVYQLLNYHMDKSKDERVAAATVMQKCIQYLDPKRINNPQIHPSPYVYDQFAILMLKMFSIVDEIRNNDLTELLSVQKIFGKQMKKNRKVQSEAMNGKISAPQVIISADQLAAHRDFFVTIADLARILASDSVGGGGGLPKTEEPVSVWSRRSDRIDKAIKTLKDKDATNAMSVIEAALKCCNNLLKKTTFSSNWIVMRMVEAEVAMRCFSWFGSTLKQNCLGDSFESGRMLWKQWLRLGMLFLSSEDFALEDMSDEAAAIIRDRYGDIRNVAIGKLSDAWKELTPHRAALADTMIKAAVEASASEVEEIQDFAVDVYFQMIKSEFETLQNINSVETHTIDQIDQLTAKYSNKENVINRYLDFFRKRVKEKLDNSDNAQLAKVGNAFLSDIERLYNYLVQLKKLPNTAQYEDERTSATLKLLEYLKGSGKNELYTRYIHHLALMHQSLGNHTEAGICFKSHGDMLGWTDRVLKEEPLVGLPSSEEWKRHVDLLELAHKHFMLGEAWEMGVSVCQELARAYQEEIFDLKALSSILEKQSHLWKLIGQQDRVFHSSYLVRFIGDFTNAMGDDNLFVEDLSNKSFVYRSGNGKMTEGVRDFTERIKRKYKDIKVVNSMEGVKGQQGPIIQITTLSPASFEELNGGPFKWDQGKYQKAPLPLRKYYRENETAVYFYTNAVQKKKHKKDNEFRSLWITKTFIVCQDSVPSTRRRIPVISEKEVVYTPFRTAINQLAEKTADVDRIIIRLEGDPKKTTNDISMNLNGILDAAVMGGVAKYREAFFDGTYFSEFPNETELVPEFVDTLKQQMVVAKRGLDAYEKYAIDALQPHVVHLEKCYKKQMIALSEFYKETQKYSSSNY